jgi:nucleoid-associated protein YgaU
MDLETVTPRQPRTVELGPAPGEPLDPVAGVTGGSDTTDPPTETPAEVDPPTTQPDAEPGVRDNEPAQPAQPVETPETRPGTRTTPPPARQPGDVPETYTVKPGDMLVTIAERLYGTQTAWEAIAQANPSVDPTRLQVGQVLRLPPRSSVNRPRQEQPAPPPGERERYTVQPGDNLSRIAERFYGSAEHWEIIYNHNREAIGVDPGRLRAGMTLDIPPALPERD